LSDLSIVLPPCHPDRFFAFSFPFSFSFPFFFLSSFFFFGNVFLWSILFFLFSVYFNSTVKIRMWPLFFPPLFTREYISPPPIFCRKIMVSIIASPSLSGYWTFSLQSALFAHYDPFCPLSRLLLTGATCMKSIASLVCSRPRSSMLECCLVNTKAHPFLLY